ncbi:hypothetical protein ACTJKY_08130 [Sphingomonas sp. 22176]
MKRLESSACARGRSEIVERPAVADLRRIYQLGLMEDELPFVAVAIIARILLIEAPLTVTVTLGFFS